MRGGSRGGQRGGAGFSRGGRGGGRGGFGGGGNRKLCIFKILLIGFEQGPPEYVEAVAEFSHASEGMLICNVLGGNVPLLMRSIYLQNKNKIGKVDDVFGQMSKPGLAIKPDEGVKAESFKAGDKLYADP